MLALILVSLLAAASAAPHFHHHHGHRPFGNYHDDFSPFMHEDVFDTAGFWQKLETEMQEMESMLNSFRVHFAVGASTEGVVGGQYQVRIPLNGFKENEIVVKARQGVLMVQAVQKLEGGSERNYLDMRTLPSNVGENGVWTYKDDVLTINFPLKTGSSTESAVTEDNVTEDPSSREEMSTRVSDDAQDADVGVQLDKEGEIRTNEIPKVEATTYAVDLKNEFEFVPVHY